MIYDLCGFRHDSSFILDEKINAKKLQRKEL